MRRAARLIVLLAVATAPAGARAHVEGASRVTLFSEPGKGGSGISVVHPQGDVSADLADTLSLNAGYEVDVVSGSTPRIFGPSSGPDAVSGATKFKDLRQAAHAGFGIQSSIIGVSAGYSYGWESDYKSHTGSVAAHGDFLDRNFTLSLAYTRNFDFVCDQNNDAAASPLELQALTSSQGCFTAEPSLVTRRLDVHTFEPALTWTASPRLVLQTGATLQVADGFQASPYRRVLVGSQGHTPQEHVPGLRQRYAVFVRGNYALPFIKASLSMMGRAYRDTWDLRAATGEAALQKYLGPSIIVGLRGRYHQQGGAVFYRTATNYIVDGPAGQYWTGDRELSPMKTILAGVKLSYLRRAQQPDAVLDELELGVKAEMLLYRIDPDAPNASRKSAFITQVALALRF